VSFQYEQTYINLKELTHYFLDGVGTLLGRKILTQQGSEEEGPGIGIGGNLGEHILMCRETEPTLTLEYLL
jgi:hypothetical protein